MYEIVFVLVTLAVELSSEEVSTNCVVIGDKVEAVESFALLVEEVFSVDVAAPFVVLGKGKSGDCVVAFNVTLVVDEASEGEEFIVTLVELIVEGSMVVLVTSVSILYAGDV